MVMAEDDQFKINRIQRVSFTNDEVKVLNKTIDVLERHGVHTTPNKFLKKEAIARAKEILDEEK